MEIKRRTLFLMLTGLLLLNACSPAAPVGGQDPTQVQQFIKDSVAGTVAAEKALATEPQALVVQPTSTPTLIPEASATSTPAPGFETVTPSSSGFETVTPETTEPPTEPPVDDTDVIGAYDIYCESLDSPSTQQAQLPTQVAVGTTVTVHNKVNLRTQPSRLKRIILTLKPGTDVKIVGGPVTTNYGPGMKYVWWQVELPGGLRGWSAELSVCGRYYFLGPTYTPTASP